MKGPRKSKPVGVLTKTFRILDILQDSPSAIPLKEIAQQTAINKSTALRFLTHLETERFVARDARGRYTLGEKLRRGARPTLDINLREAAQAPLRELWRITQETVNLGVLDGVEVVYLDCLESPQSFRLVANAGGTRALAYRTALGKAMIAHFSAERRKALIESFVFQPFTPKTIVSAERFQSELETVRKLGYSIDDEESVLGVRCLGAPIFNAKKEPIAGLSISGPTARVTDATLPEFAAAIRAAAEQISSRLLPDR